MQQKIKSFCSKKLVSWMTDLNIFQVQKETKAMLEMTAGMDKLDNKEPKGTKVTQNFRYNLT